eukprot:14679684-Ditylum_brightwellii.AAC.1
MAQHQSSTYIDVVALAAAKSDPDTPSFKEFKEAMTKEVDALQKRSSSCLRVLRLFPPPGQ